jgi:hypothetical protein
VLQIWKGHAIPQPAVFWTPEAWRAAGPLDEGVGTAWIDYDLFCRLSRRYRFHVVDQVLAAYRLHPTSKTGQRTEAERLTESIRISRRYWGSPLSPVRWALELSLLRYRFDRIGRGRRWLRRSAEAWSRGRVIPAVAQAAGGVALAPEVAFFVTVYPPLRDRARGLAGRLLDRLAVMTSLPPQTEAYLGYTDVWGDRWVGPRLVVAREAGPDARAVRIAGWIERKYLQSPMVLTVRIDDETVGEVHVDTTGAFVHDVPLPRPPASDSCRLEIEASTWYVPHRFTSNGDFRPLSWRMDEVSIVRGAPPPDTA